MFLWRPSGATKTKTKQKTYTEAGKEQTIVIGSQICEKGVSFGIRILVHSKRIDTMAKDTFNELTTYILRQFGWPLFQTASDKLVNKLWELFSVMGTCNII